MNEFQKTITPDFRGWKDVFTTATLDCECECVCGDISRGSAGLQCGCQHPTALTRREKTASMGSPLSLLPGCCDIRGSAFLFLPSNGRLKVLTPWVKINALLRQLFLLQPLWCPFVISIVMNMERRYNEWGLCFTCLCGSQFRNWFVGRIFKNMHTWAKEAQENCEQNSVDDCGGSSEEQTESWCEVRRKGRAQQMSNGRKDPTWNWTRGC